MIWSTIRKDQISRFTSDNKEKFKGMAGIVITTYNMVAFGGKRSEDSEKIIEEIRNREWGLLLMDEVMIFGKLCFSVYMKVGENPMFFFL
jgi:DNA excision repair protein ERCC-3